MMPATSFASMKTPNFTFTKANGTKAVFGTDYILTSSHSIEIVTDDMTIEGQDTNWTIRLKSSVYKVTFKNFSTTINYDQVTVTPAEK